MKYKQDIIKLISLLGGSENIKTLTHCVSRMRLIIIDKDKINDNEIKKLSSCKGTISLPNNQYHVVIGSDIDTFYEEFLNISKLNGSDKKQLNEELANSGNFMQRAMNHLSEIFIPLIPALVAGGLILGIRNIFEANFNNYVLVEKFAFIKGLNEFLWVPAQAVFWYLPVTISWSIFKKMKGSEALGIILGLSMLIAPLLNTYEVSGSGLHWIWDLDLKKVGFDFGSFQFPWKISYTGQVVPAIIVAFSGVYIERWLNKVITPVLKQIIVPVGTIIISYTLAMAVIGPLGWTIGTAISFGVKAVLLDPFWKYVFAPIFGLLYAPLVITGMHHMINAVMIQNTAQLGGSLFFPILAISNIAQGAAVITFIIKHKRKEKTKQIGISALTSAWLGITEPALYGINIRYVYPFVGAICGSAVGSFILCIAGVTSSGIGNGAWLGVLSIQAQSKVEGIHTWPGSGQLWFIVAGIVSTIVAMLITSMLSNLKKAKDLENKVGVI